MLVEAMDRVLRDLPARAAPPRRGASSRGWAWSCARRPRSCTSRTAWSAWRRRRARRRRSTPAPCSGRRASSPRRSGARWRRPRAPRRTATAGCASGRTSRSPATRRSSSSATRRSSRGSRTAPRPGVAQGGIQGGSYAAKAVLARLRGQPIEAVPLQQPRRRRGHRPAARRDRHPVDGAVRPAGRLHRLAAVAADPHHLPDRVREPDRGRHPLGVLVPDPRPVDAADHRASRWCRRSRSRRRSSRRPPADEPQAPATSGTLGTPPRERPSPNASPRRPRSASRPRPGCRGSRATIPASRRDPGLDRRLAR